MDNNDDNNTDIQREIANRSVSIIMPTAEIKDMIDTDNNVHKSNHSSVYKYLITFPFSLLFGYIILPILNILFGYIILPFFGMLFTLILFPLYLFHKYLRKDLVVSDALKCDIDNIISISNRGV